MILSQPQPTYPCTYMPSLVHLPATATQDYMSHTRPLTSASCQGKERVTTCASHRITNCQKHTRPPFHSRHTTSTPRSLNRIASPTAKSTHGHLSTAVTPRPPPEASIASHHQLPKAHTTTFPQPSHHVDTQKPQASLPHLTVLITYGVISHALPLARARSPFADDDRAVCLPRRCCRVGAASRVEHITRSGARSLLGHSRRAEETGRVGHSSRGPRAFGSNLHRRPVDCSRS
jgi:hypothetical protein